jgi:hypothetical protein
VLLSELTASARRLALVGLAKNTGKTVALATLLRELEAANRRVGVTSVGRDGEARDVIDRRIEKPRIDLAAGSFVATTDGLLSASGLPHELLEQTGVRTPLGQVLIARLESPGAIEVAGPSAAEDVRAVCDAMLSHGAERVLIDGAIDRRAASSPAVADGLVIATGAILSEDVAEVVAQTKDAVETIRLPALEDPRLRALASAHAASVLVDEDYAPIALAPRFVLTSSPADVAELMRRHGRARAFLVSGALCEPFLESLLRAARGREVQIVVADSTKVFLSRRGPSSYRHQGLAIEALNPIEPKAITVNPVAPRAHRFDSKRLRALIEEALGGVVPVLDVLHSDYGATDSIAR